MKYAISVDLGGTQWRVALINEEYSIITKEVGITSKLSTPHKIIQLISKVIKLILKENSIHDLSGIGVCFPGPFNEQKKEKIVLPNLPLWSNIDIKELFQTYLNFPLFFENDANAAVLGEQLFNKSKNLVYITISTGIGSACILDNKLIKGSQGKALELGHIPLDSNGPICSCGKKGHLEAFASGSAIEREFKRLLFNRKDSVLSNNSDINTKKIFEAALKNDSLAKEVFKSTGNYIGHALLILIPILNPEKIIFGGGVSNAFDFFIESIQLKLTELMPTFKNSIVICKSKLGDNSGLLGMSQIIFNAK